MNRKSSFVMSFTSAILILFSISFNCHAQVNPNESDKSEKKPQIEKKENEENIKNPSEEIKAETPQEALLRIYTERNKALVSGDMTKLKELFDIRQKTGLWALEHEVKRVKYLKHWAKERGIEFTNIQSEIRVKRNSNRGDKFIMALEESYKFDYIYSDDNPAVLNSFGVGIRHGVSMIKREGKWIVFNDWYTDCFEDAIAGFTGDIPQNTNQSNGADTIKKPNVSTMPKTEVISNLRGAWGYNREKAVQYADKYCGSAWGSGNNYKYNKLYRDFTGIGGDCTNFASQVLGDKKEGGGLRFGGGWHCQYYKYGGSEGSRAWVNADGLRDYLIHSGRGSLIKKGVYKELAVGNENNTVPAVNRLQLGDLVAYQKKGDIDHFAVVTGRDSRGYPLINSHTTDRYHVPWDLGWGDKWIKFHLIHVN